jgi:ankyrin repeat protein
MSTSKSPKRTKVGEFFLGKRNKDYAGLYVGDEENVAGEEIYDAVADNDNNKLQKLCKEWGNIDAAINWRAQDDEYKFTPLLIGCLEGHVDCVKTLVKQKAISINLPDAYGATPIWWAASKGHKDVVEVLLKTKGIDIKKKPKTDDKLTPIEIAEKEGHAATAEVLQKYSTPKKGVLSRLFGRGGTAKNQKKHRITKKNKRLV